MRVVWVLLSLSLFLNCVALAKIIGLEWDLNREAWSIHSHMQMQDQALGAIVYFQQATSGYAVRDEIRGPMLLLAGEKLSLYRLADQQH